MVQILINALLRLLNGIIIKNNKQIVFINYKFSDNAKSFFEYIRENHPDYKLIWLYDEEKYFNKLNMHIIRYKRKSVKGMWHFFKGRYIVTSHFDNVGIKSTRQKYVSLWHGMPLKKIGWYERNKNDHRYEKADIIISTSYLMKSILASCFHVDPKKVFITGQPRNDKLFHANKDEIIRKIVSSLTPTPNIIISYLPTFRSFGGYKDGEHDFLEELFSDDNCNNLNKILCEYNAALFVKAHYYENINKILGNVNSYSNIKFINDDDLIINGIDLYDLLGSTDILITDYSSVYFDYLLLNKPILFYVPDLNRYRSARGFILEPFDFWTPGPKAQTVKEFNLSLVSLLENPNIYEQERKLINSLLNQYRDDQSCVRVWDLMMQRNPLNIT